MKTRDVILDPRWVNLLSIPLTLGLLALALGVHLLIWGLPDLTSLDLIFDLRIFLPLLVGGILLHEGLHALGWKLASGLPWRAFKFGMIWKALMPFAHCKEPMNARAYRVGAFLPGLLTGLLPLLAGWIPGALGGTLLGALFSIAASGDWLVLWAIRSIPPQAQVLDHPNLPGCQVIEVSSQ